MYLTKRWELLSQMEWRKQENGSYFVEGHDVFKLNYYTWAVYDGEESFYYPNFTECLGFIYERVQGDVQS